MRILILQLIFFFSLQSLTIADDISEFQIEGMSVGDSLLDYMSKEQITSAENNSSTVGTGDKKFIVIWGPNLDNIYDSIQITYKAKDTKYIIHAIDGKLDFKDDFNGCKKKMREIESDIKNIFSQITPDYWETNHGADHTGKSKTEVIDFVMKNAGLIQIWCTDWSNEMFEEHGWEDDLALSLRSEEYHKFINSSEYSH